MPPAARRSADPKTAKKLARAAESLAAGRTGEALQALRQAAAADPRDAAIQNDRGVIALQAGLLAEAEAAFRAALSASPRFAQASLRLGVALQAQGQAAAALDAYRHAARLLPSLAEAQFRAGALLEALGDRPGALDAFRRAAAAAPDSPAGGLAAARALLMEGRDAEAERALRRLLARAPDHPAANEMLGGVLAESGRFIEARACFARAIAAAPLLAGSYYELVRCARVTPDDAGLLARMGAALAIPGLPAEARLKLHLALGKAQDDLGDPGAAMQHFGAADAIRAGLSPFDAAGFAARVDAIIARCTPQSLARAAASGSGETAPVLIVGLPRSGTTLVEQILSCHPSVQAGGELPFWAGRGAVWERAGSAGMEPAFLAAAASDYVRLLRSISPGAARVTDKMPLNLLWAGLVHAALPRATIVHVRRSPIDTALSIHRTYFNLAASVPTGGPALVAMIRDAGRLAAHWRAVLPPGRFIEIGYEQLVSSPEPEIRRLLAACGLEWEPRCLRPQDNPRSIKTPSLWQARQPIHAASVGAWRRYEPWLGALRGLVG